MSAASAAGLCAGCRYSRIIRTSRGSTFRLCERSTMDVRFPRYPALPVVRCPGFEPAPDTAVLGPGPDRGEGHGPLG